MSPASNGPDFSVFESSRFMRACRRVAVAPSARAENRCALFAWSHPPDRGRPPRALRLPPPFTFRGDRQPSRPRTQCESGERDRHIEGGPTDPYVIMNVMMIHFNSRSPFTSAQVSIQGSSMYQPVYRCSNAREHSHACTTQISPSQFGCHRCNRL